MKLSLLIITFQLISALGFGQEADFFVEKPIHKFPKTYEGVVLEHTFRIENRGDIPLIISSYSVGCSCTKVVLPKEPIPPGGHFDLKVTFDSAGKYYYQDRTIILKTNTKSGEEKVRFKVNVIPKNE
ncbi:MAG: DUF1573 domain-containing protein [Bacteroidetes bacterium]|nr:MAG: DUF1573 domain-containing protein [Bacteroidota bacterium]